MERRISFPCSSTLSGARLFVGGSGGFDPLAKMSDTPTDIMNRLRGVDFNPPYRPSPLMQTQAL